VRYAVVLLVLILGGCGKQMAEKQKQVCGAAAAIMRARDAAYRNVDPNPTHGPSALMQAMRTRMLQFKEVVGDGVITHWKVQVIPDIDHGKPTIGFILCDGGEIVSNPFKAESRSKGLLAQLKENDVIFISGKMDPVESAIVVYNQPGLLGAIGTLTSVCYTCGKPIQIGINLNSVDSQ